MNDNDDKIYDNYSNVPPVEQSYVRPQRGSNLALDLAIIQGVRDSFRNQVNQIQNQTEELHEEKETLKEELKKTQAQHANNNKKANFLQTNLILANKKIQQYEVLLSKPMQFIAEHNPNFKKNFEEQQTVLADWMVSQKAFKELAIQLGKQLGLSVEEVIQMGLSKEIDVLEDKNDPSHKTNVGNSTIIGPRKELLKEKYNQTSSLDNKPTSKILKP
jgi:chromosome segregation ATPase